MLKRALTVGVALAFTLFGSLTSFAYTSSVSMGFPYFSHLGLRRDVPGNYIYQGSPGSRPISGVSSDVNGSSFQSGSMFVFEFLIGSTYNFSVQDDSKSFSYKVPYVNRYLISEDASYWQGSGYAGNYYEEFVPGTGVTEKTYTVTIPASTESVTIKNDTISGGDYAITGFLEFPSGTISSIDDLFIGSASSYILVGSEGDPISVDVTDIRFNLSDGDRQVVQFMTVLNVPESVSGISSGGLLLALYTKPNVSSPITRFGISTGGFEYKDTVSGIGGLSSQLGNWFSGLKSQLGGIAQLLRLQQDDAQQAASDADRAAVSEASSSIQEIHQFEADLNTNITSTVSQIDFTIPSTSGFLGAMGAITFVFGSIFESLGAYQFIITIPLILGILLLLLGRGQATLGRILRRHDE